MSNTIITAEDAQYWLDDKFPSREYQEIQYDRFFDTPHASMHAFVAMRCIAKCAETPQDYEAVYFAVRDWANILDPDSPDEGVAQNRNGINREAVVARAEMTSEEYDENITFKLIELGISLD